jgi:hypothetical protein
MEVCTPPPTQGDQPEITAYNNEYSDVSSNAENMTGPDETVSDDVVSSDAKDMPGPDEAVSQGAVSSDAKDVTDSDETVSHGAISLDAEDRASQDESTSRGGVSLNDSDKNNGEEQSGHEAEISAQESATTSEDSAATSLESSDQKNVSNEDATHPEETSTPDIDEPIAEAEASPKRVAVSPAENIYAAVDDATIGGKITQELPGSQTATIAKSKFRTMSDPSIDVSVPTKLIFAAFESDGGGVRAPGYVIRNNGDAPVNVSLSSVKVIDQGALRLTNYANEENEFDLQMVGSVGDEFTGNLTEGVGDGTFTVNLTEDISEDIFMGRLDANDGESGADRAENILRFTLAGRYIGGFDIPRTPQYKTTFKIRLAGEEE